MRTTPETINISSEQHTKASAKSRNEGIAKAISDLGLVVTTRWRLVRSFRTRVFFALAAYIITIIAGLALNAGALFADLATYANSEESTLARVWLGNIADGDYGLLGISFVATGFGIALLAPFTGASSLTLIDDDSAMPFSFARGRRFFDSITFAAISGVGVVHFIVTILTASLLSVDGVRLPGIGLALLLWMSFLGLASVIGWLSEIAVAKVGKIVKWIYGFVLAGIAGLAYTQQAVQDVLISVANGYGVWVRAASVPMYWWSPLVAYVAAFILLATLIFFGFWLARLWDNLPPHFSGRAAGSTKSFAGGFRATSIWAIILKVLWRTREVKRTVIAVSIAGSVSSTYFFATAPDSIIAGLMIGVPAISMLIWPSNAFGVFGSGLTWMLSQPKFKTNLPFWLAGISQAQTVLIMLVLLVPMSIFHLDLLSEVSMGTWLAGAANLTLLPAVALFVALRKPHTVRLTGRGESILPPAAAISYLAGFGALAAAVSAIVTAFEALGPGYAYYGLLLIVVAALALLAAALRMWQEPKIQQKVLYIATGD
jgi:hypothetical protein